MNVKLLLIFIALNAVNVILQTVKSICTIKCGKTAAAAINALCYGLYTVVIVYTVCDLPLLAKVFIVAGCNFVGVWVVKFIEQKMRKDRLWKIEVTIHTGDAGLFDWELDKIPHGMIKLSDKHTLFNIYCENQGQTNAVKDMI